MTRLIDADALKEAVNNKKVVGRFNTIQLIDNAPTVKDRSLEIAQKSIELGRKVGQLEGKLERPQGDLISRSELKKCAIPCQIHNGALTDLCVPLYQIDNAPTVEYPQERREADKSGDLISREALKKALTEAHINMTLTFDIATFNCVMNTIDNAPTVEQRPQSEWIDGYCNKCGGSTLCDGWGMDVKSRFCPNCGADMRGEE